MKLAIIRSSALILSGKHYNLQEVGLAKSLLSFGISTDIYLARQETSIQKKVIEVKGNCKIRIFHLPHIRLPGKQALFPSLFHLLSDENYDVIQVHEYPMITACLVSVFGAYNRIPVVVCQGIYKDYKGFVSSFLQTLYDLSCLLLLRRYASAWIAKTESAADYLCSKGVADVKVCPIGLDTGPLKDTGGRDSRHRFSIPQDAKVLLYVGVIEKRRNVDFIIRLVDSLVKEEPNIYLLIVGNGPELESCKRLTRDFKLQNRVVFAGKIPQVEMPSIYNATDIFLLPSNYEIYGMVILEAMFFGVPIISTCTAGAEEIIQNGVDGILVQGVNLEGWIPPLKKLLEDISLRNKLSKNAMVSIRNRFLWERTAIKFNDVYQDLFRSHSK